MHRAGPPGLLPHHDGSGLHAPQQVALGDEARLRVRVPAGWGRATRVWLRSIQDGEPRYDALHRLGEADGWVWWEAPMTVTNPVARYRFLLEVPVGQAVRRRRQRRGRRGPHRPPRLAASCATGA